ncbi:MAG: hypothetical protein ACJAZM_001819 [Cyclobacteriaceae bacterium]|jgi:hypothetical protein
MARIFLTVFLVFTSMSLAFGQYWFGVKAGSQLTLHDFQSDTYEDTFEVANDFDILAGILFTYTANRRYSVHTEVYYKRIEKELKNTLFTTPAKTYIKNHYLSAPFMLRVNFSFGNSPFQMYVNGGTELNYWLGANGGLSLEEFDEFFSEEELLQEFPVTYQVVFREGARNADNQRLITEGNRLQYGVTAGFGASFDFANGSRILLDARYVHAHSNLGFNGSPDFEWVGYYENFEVRPHQFALTIGYQIEYNASLARKGKSTLRESN